MKYFQHASDLIRLAIRCRWAGRKPPGAVPPDAQHGGAADVYGGDGPADGRHGLCRPLLRAAAVQARQLPPRRPQGRVHHLAQEGTCLLWRVTALTPLSLRMPVLNTFQNVPFAYPGLNCYSSCTIEIHSSKCESSWDGKYTTCCNNNGPQMYPALFYWK